MTFKEFINEENYLGECLLIIKENPLNEDASSTRYSIEVNFRTKSDEVLKNYAKLVLGFVSAGMKEHKFHIKHVYTEDPIRILINSGAWRDGENTISVSWSPKENCFIVAKGFYNKDRKTISINSHERIKEDNASEITKFVYNLMHHLKTQPDRTREHLKSVNLKRGPKS